MPVTINGSGGFTANDGSAAAPSIAGTDSNTGIFFPAADTVAIATGGTERVRTDSSGNVLLGLTSWSYAGNNGMQIRSGVGSNASLFLETASAAVKGFVASDTNVGRLGVGTLSNHPLVFIANDAERARITSAGDFLVGTTSTSTPTTSTADVYLGGIAMTPSRRTTASAANVNIDPTSGLFARSTSSLKYKRDVENATHGLAEVMALRPVTYKGKSEADGDKVFGGLIAEEVHEAGLTEFVQYAGDGSPDSLAYGNMVALAFKAIQEQQALIESLTARIAALEGAAA